MTDAAETAFSPPTPPSPCSRRAPDPPPPAPRAPSPGARASPRPLLPAALRARVGPRARAGWSGRGRVGGPAASAPRPPPDPLGWSLGRSPPGGFSSVLFACASGRVESRFPDQGANVHRLHRMRRVLTTGPPGPSRPKHSWASFSFRLCSRISNMTGDSGIGPRNVLTWVVACGPCGACGGKGTASHLRAFLICKIAA
ncbi:hypothetical protein R6Z07F_009448 [Ovis aries]